MKKIVLCLCFIFLLISCLSASITKLYLGNEEGQFILGIEGFANNVDGGAGMEIRTYFRRNGLVINGQEYGSLPGKTRYSFLLAGTNEEGGLLRFRKHWTYTRDEYYDSLVLTKENQIEFGGGRGNYILYH